MNARVSQSRPYVFECNGDLLMKFSAKIIQKMAFVHNSFFIDENKKRNIGHSHFFRIVNSSHLNSRFFRALLFQTFSYKLALTFVLFYGFLFKDSTIADLC